MCISKYSEKLIICQLKRATSVAVLGVILWFPWKPLSNFKIQIIFCCAPRPPACCNNKQLRDCNYINTYIPTIILHVYFCNDVASLRKSDVTESESESDDCQ